MVSLHDQEPCLSISEILGVANENSSAFLIIMLSYFYFKWFSVPILSGRSAKSCPEGREPGEAAEECSRLNVSDKQASFITVWLHSL